MVSAQREPEIGIIGVGDVPLGASGLSALALIGTAARDAISDAGVEAGSIDGLIVAPGRGEMAGSAATLVQEYLGLRPRRFATIDLAGASGCAMIDTAVQWVQTGRAARVLCVAGDNTLTRLTRGGAVASMAEGTSIHPQLEVPMGPILPSMYALAATRYMHEFGATEEQLAQVAVEFRRHAQRNPHAFKTEEIDVGAVLKSKMISYPLHLLDCSVIADGAAAAVVGRAPQADGGARRHPIAVVRGVGYGSRHTYLGSAASLTTTGAVESGKEAFAAAGRKPQEIDVAEIYDCFSITVLLLLEDLGFCEKGQGGSFVADGAIGMEGKLPVTTWGGLLSAGHPGLAGGFLHVVEAARQAMGKAGERQIRDAELVLAHGNGGILATHCTLILERGPG